MNYLYNKNYDEVIESVKRCRGFEQFGVYLSITDPDSITKMQDIIRADKSAATEIAELQNAIEVMQKYRIEIARRYGQLETMSYKDRLTISRYKSYSSKKVTFTVTLERILEDGTKTELQFKTFGGNEKKQAFEYFRQLKKDNPAAETIIDTAKQIWER